MEPLRWGEVFCHRDESGRRRHGVVGQIVAFSNGKTVVGWFGFEPTLEEFSTVDALLATFGSPGAAVVYWDKDLDVQRLSAETPSCLNNP